MGLISIPGGAECPAPILIPGGPAFSSGPVLDGASDKVGTWFSIPKTGNVRKIHWATRTVTTGATLDVRLETAVSTTGTWASGAGGTNTLFGTNTNGSQVVNASDDNAFFATTLTADAAVTAGDAAGVVLVNPSGSPGNMTIAAIVTDTTVVFPYSAIDAAGAGTYAFGVNVGWNLMLALEYDDGSIVPIQGLVPPATAITATSMSTSTTPDVAGARFSLSFPCRLAGLWVVGDMDGAFKAMLVSTAYNQSAPAPLASVTHPGDQRRNGATGWYRLWFPTPYELVAGTTYRLVIEPTGGTTVQVIDLNVPTLAALDAYQGGQNFHLTTAKDPTGDGDWTNYNSGTFRHPLMGLILDQFADDTGGAVSGGGIRIAGHGGLAA